MLKKQMAPVANLSKRRAFLSRAAALGGMAVIGAAAGPVQAARKASSKKKKSRKNRKAIKVSNATIKDFARLKNKKFHLRAPDGTRLRVKLAEANAPATRRALRFRREHFSLIFNVPRRVELVSGRYRLEHPRIGSMKLFMSPVDLPEKYNRLEAVFT